MLIQCTSAHSLFITSIPARQVKLFHHNPVSGKWNLAADFVSYEHSSASSYEEGIIKHFEPKLYKSL